MNISTNPTPNGTSSAEIDALIQNAFGGHRANAAGKLVSDEYCEKHSVALIAEVAKIVRERDELKEDRFISFGGLKPCPKCRVFTDMSRHYCRSLEYGVFEIGYRDSAIASQAAEE